MATEFEPAGFGIGGTIGWAVGGALGGGIAAAAFGLLMWVLDPEIVEAAIPAIYGFDQSTVLGMSFHLLHGAVLGLVFGFVVTRPWILGIIVGADRTETVSETGLTLRVIASGFVFGLAIWAILPVIVLPAWVDAVGGPAAGEFPTAAVESMIGHMVFGLVLGLVFAVVVNLRGRPFVDVLSE